MRMSKTKRLTEAEVIKLMREEWDLRVKRFSESLELTAIVPGKTKEKKKEKLVISPGLKVTHRKSGLRYTVDSAGPQDCILITPEGDTFIVDATKLEKEYELS